MSWLPALTCLGRARKGNGWELPSNHELVLPPPPFLSLPIPFPPSQPEGGLCCTAQNCSGTLGLGFFPPLFSSLSDEFLPFPCAPSQRGLLLQQRVSVVQCVFSSPRVWGGCSERCFALGAARDRTAFGNIPAFCLTFLRI